MMQKPLEPLDPADAQDILAELAYQDAVAQEVLHTWQDNTFTFAHPDEENLIPW